MQSQRPGPLRDLPLDQFVAESNLSHAHAPSYSRHRIPSNKRPASPERLPDGSPLKRRLLADERGIAPSPRTSRLPSAHSTPSISTDISGLDGRQADASVEPPQRARGREASLDLPWGGHNGTTAAAAPAKPRRMSPRLNPALPLTPSASGSPLSSSGLVPIPENYPVASAPSASGPQSMSDGHGAGSMHYPGFHIYHDSQPVPHGSHLPSNEPLSSESASSQHAPAQDKENIPPPEALAAPFVLKKKIRFMDSSTPCTPIKGTFASPSSYPASHGLFTPLARSFQSATLASPSKPSGSAQILSRTSSSSLGSPFLGSTTPRRTPMDKSERMNLRRQLTEEADGMDY
ncbi:hypothetical protein BC629DRAFT_1723447 [Irpex lacteus]|nr:hypothetical protein BC629DRAFT_1723447 [Irpex lacteus]